MTVLETSSTPRIDLKELGFANGAQVLLKRALQSVPVGGHLAVTGTDPALDLHLAAWCRSHGHRVEHGGPSGTTTIVRGAFDSVRWQGATQAGGPSSAGVLDRAEATWGLAARGAVVEAGGPDLGFDLNEKSMVWTDLAPRLYAQAAASQWDPATAIEWQAVEPLPDDVEAVVVQVMTYLVENEQAALAVVARFLGRIHPHYREVVQLLAVQVADEARHIEVFARRAGLHPEQTGVSTVGSRTSLGMLLAEPDFALASFLLSVLGEGTFLNLLSFLEHHAPDRIVQQSARLVLQDEARHVAFAMSHLEYQLNSQPELRSRLRASIERRHEALRSTAGLGEEILDALVVLAAGSWQPEAIANGFAAVQKLQSEMAEGRQLRLMRLGFSAAEGDALASLHTRNFM